MKQRGAKSKVRTGHIVSHTHWDREWRYPIWETRFMLLDFFDELVVALENDVCPSFLMDGQVSPIFDYLEIRPGMSNRIKELVRAGKLLVGPWLILPDEYPVDGESLVRNLLYGISKSKELGGIFKVGYTSFGWGQTAQLPQIYAGFGIDVAMVGKRISKHRAPKSEFLWCAPDGSKLLATRFGDWGRANFYFKVHLSALFGIDHEGVDWQYDWSKGGVAYHRADRAQMEQDHFRLDEPSRWHPEYITAKVAEEAWRTTDESVMEDDRLMMNGCDYTAIQPMFPQMVDRLNEIDNDSDRKWVQSSMSEFVKIMKEKIDVTKLMVVEGELRDGPAGSLTGNALTTRLYLKRLNKHAQNMLIRFAEPLSVIASLTGADFNVSFITKAWEFLLSAHPHDSINGVTQDETVDGTMGRLDQVIELSQAIGNRAMQELVSRIDMREFDDKDVLIVVLNPLPYPRHEILEAWINMPGELAHNRFWTHESEGLQMLDATGTLVSTQWQGQSSEKYCVAELHTRAFPFNCQRHRIFFDTGELPAGGYKIFKANTLVHTKTIEIQLSDSKARTGTLLVASNILENEFLRIKMNPNGTFDMSDKRMGRTFYNFNYYEDRGEHGDYWVNERPMFDHVHTSLGCSARIWSEVSGPLIATLVSEITMKLPHCGDKQNQKRGSELVEMTIRTKITLKAGNDQVEVKVDFDNDHKDHYLRVMFPTGLVKATHADAGGHFIVDHRPIRPQGPRAGMVWPDMATLPQNNFVDVSDGTIGLAFLNDSLTEYEVCDTDERVVALSLLRSVKNWICTELRVGSGFPSQDGGQCIGEHSIRYAIKPHAGNWQDANIPLAAELFNVPVIPVQTRKHDGKLPAGQSSLFEITNRSVRFSTLKKAENRETFIARIYNPTAEVQKTNIVFCAPIESAWQTNLNEERLEQISHSKNMIEIAIRPYQIMTVEFETNQRVSL